jgi:hypothetical protein
MWVIAILKHPANRIPSMPNPGSFVRTTIVVAFGLLSTPASAQDVSAQLRDLQSAIETLRSELAQARRESDELRRELQAIRQDLTARASGEEQELLAAKVDELEQTKVESGSKYHVRLSGLALLQASLTQGEVDSADVPSVARPRVPGLPGGSITGGARQSYFRVEVFGPRVAGARTAGETTLDFFGGFPTTTEGFTSGFARLRTVSLSLDWDDSRLVAGNESPFFSPASPTSLLQSAYPAFWATGNMWSWVPQVHAEHRITAGGGAVLVQGGVLDPLTGELPVSEYDRVPTAGERTRRPAAAARVAWQHGEEARRTVWGAGAYYSRQTWGFGRDLNAWAATADWNVPLGNRVSWSGELYRGQAIAGLGATAAPSVTFLGNRENPASLLLPFRSAGGWTQLKVAPDSRLEFNAAVGTDRSAPPGMTSLVASGLVDPGIVRRNLGVFVNGIYTVRSNLLFTVEYRRLRTETFNGTTNGAGHLSVGGGLGF